MSIILAFLCGFCIGGSLFAFIGRHYIIKADALAFARGYVRGLTFRYPAPAGRFEDGGKTGSEAVSKKE